MHQGAMRLARRLAIAFAVVTVPGLAAAPSDQYQFFTQGSTTITDSFTGLVWERVVGQRVSYGVAKTHCDNASMRLPSLKELLTIVDEDPHLEYEGTQNVTKMIDGAAFPKTPSGPFWTSSELSRNKHIVTVDFLDGMTGDVDTGATAFVRCVDTP